MRLIAGLFLSLFLIGAFPVLFLQPFGFASAGITSGFLSSIQNFSHVTAAIIIGLLAAWVDGEAMLLLPLCALLMLVIGALSEINPNTYHGVHAFLLGAIILFAMSVNLMRNPSLFIYIGALSVWAYFSGSNFMQNIPPITTPLFFMMGMILGTALTLAIGVTLGMTLADRIRKYAQRFRSSTVFFTSLF